MSGRPRFAYELVSHWRVPGPPSEVYAALTDSAALPRWWPAAYQRVQEVAPGDARGVGRVSQIVTRGRLPYELKWQLVISEAAPPGLIRLAASGDVEGTGEWRLKGAGPDTELTYTWRVSVTRTWMRLMEPLLRPLFRLNHDWVMREGERGLREEMARRLAAEP